MKKKTKIPKYAQGSTVGSIVGAGVGALGFIGGPALGMATMGLGSQLGARVGAEFDDDNIVPQPSMPVLPMINAHTGNNVNMYPFGGMMNMPNAEVEKQEVARTPDGQTIMFDGPSHAQGGIKTNLPNGTEITSDRLINPLTGNTFAKDQKQIELKKAKLNNKLKNRPNDKYLSSSIKILDNESQKIFDLQEMMKPMEPPQQMFANGGTYRDAYSKLSPQQLAKMDAEYALAQGQGKKEYTSSVTGLRYKVEPQSSPRVFAQDLYSKPVKSTPQPKQSGPQWKTEPFDTGYVKPETKSGPSWPTKAWQPLREVVITDKKPRKKIDAPTAEINRNLADNTDVTPQRYSKPTKKSKTNWDALPDPTASSRMVSKSLPGMPDLGGAPNYKALPDVTSGPKMTMDTAKKLDKHIHTPTRMLLNDLTGVNKKTWTSNDFSQDELDYLKMTAQGVKKRTGRNYVLYSDYDNQKGSIENFTDQINPMSANSNLKYSLGRFNFKDSPDTLYINDQYNFNDRNNQGYLSNVINHFGAGNNLGYSLIRALGSTYGSPNGQGANIDIRIPKKALGGTIKYDNGGTFKFPYTNQWNNNKSDYDFYSNYKPLSKGYENFSPFIKFGGYNNPYQYDYMNDPNIPQGATAEDAKQFDIDRGVLSTPSTNTKTDYGMMGLGLAGVNLASQFANSFMPEKIQDTRNRFYAPALRTYGDAVQKQRNLRYNIGDQITGINNSERDANRYISNNISSGNVRAGNMLANRAASMLGRNQLYGDRNRIEYGYQADANKMQMGYGEFLNNVGQQQSLYDTNLRDMRLQQRANLRGIRAQALGNTSTMLQQYGRDQKMMQLLPYMFPNANPNMFN